MADEYELQQRAAQLRKPHGEDGIKTAEWMSQGNQHIIGDTLALLDAQADDNILEIGMGNGFFVTDILNRHPKISYTGCDFSELMVSESEKMNKHWIINGQAKFVLSDIASLPFDKEIFNKIFTINTIYFWDDVPKALDEIKRVLQPGGKFIIGFRPKHQAEKYPFTRYGFNLYSKDDVSRLVISNGFTVAEARENTEPDMAINGEIFTMENVILVAEK